MGRRKGWDLDRLLFNNLELGLAGLLMSGLFCDHLASASAVPGRLNSFAIELALVR